MSFGKSATCAVLMIAAVTTSCSGDSTTQPGDELTTEQVQSMTGALSFLIGISLAQPLACPEGGHVGSNGTFSTDSAGNGIFALTDTLVDCAIKDNHSNVWTFNSKPTVAVTIELLTNIHGDSIDLAHSTLTQSDVGSVHYVTGTLSGTCPLDVLISSEVTRGTPTADSATSTLTTTGTVCGHRIATDTSTTFPYTPPPT